MSILKMQLSQLRLFLIVWEYKIEFMELFMKNNTRSQVWWKTSGKNNNFLENVKALN